MDTTVPTIPANTKVSELSDRIARHDSLLARRQATLIVDDHNKLAGIITRGDLLRTMQQSFRQDLTVLEAGGRDLIVTYPDEPMHDAVTKMLRNNIGRLPVVSRQDPGQIVGYLGRAAVMEAWLHRHDEEHVRQAGWLASISQ